MFDAIREKGIGIGAYFSKADWHCQDYWNPELGKATWPDAPTITSVSNAIRTGEAAGSITTTTCGESASGNTNE